MSTLVSNIIKPRSGDTVTFSNSNISATDGTFSGNVSISGTVTYEDVTNVDSVGIITARSGIFVGAGESISPVSGTLTYYGDGSQLSGIDASSLTDGDGTTRVQANTSGVVVTGVVTATSFSGDGSLLTGVEAGSANFVASGNISNGDTVVINTDGTVGIVTQTGSSNPAGGAPVAFDGYYYAGASAYDSTNGKVVIAYQDGNNSNYATAIVGTVSNESGTGIGATITFGTPVVFESSHTNSFGVAYDPINEKVVIGYIQVSDYYGRAIVGTVSGTSIIFGSPVVFESAVINEIAAAYDSTNGKVVFAYRNSSNYGTAIVGTVSGTSISFGTAVVFESAAVTSISLVHDSGNNKMVFAYQDQGNSQYGTAIVGTVSGTSISFPGSWNAVVFESATSQFISCGYDSTNGKVVIAYADNSNSNIGKAIVGTVSGTSISFGTAVVFESGGIDASPGCPVLYDSDNQKIIIGYGDAGNSTYPTAIVGTVSGTSITFGTPVVLQSSAAYLYTGSYDSTNGKVVFAYSEGANQNATSAVFSTTAIVTNLTSENYIGIAGEDISNAATGKINIVGGVNSSQSGLTTAKTYYVHANGTLDTSALGTPSVVAGTSISDTKILVR